MNLLVAARSPSADRPLARRKARAARLGGRWLTLATGICAAAPVLASTVRALRNGWLPAGDQAIIATRSYEVFTSHTPLVGQYSDSSALTHHAVYSLGPMLYWLLAIPARIGSPASLAVAMGLANAAAIVGVVVLARRRGGLALMFVTAVAVVLMTRSLSAEGLHDVWNPSAGLMPFTLLVFLCWSLACGEYRLLPLTAIVASFVVQCQLTYLLPSLGALTVAIVGLIVSLRCSRAGAGAGEQAGGAPAGRGASGSARGIWRWALAALVLAVLCWTPPAIDQITGNPGNITAIARTVSADHSTLGASVGWHAVVHAVGIPPWWLTNPTSPWQRKLEVRTAPGGFATASALLVLCALLAAATVGLVRRRVELWAGALIGLALCLALALVAAQTPTTRLGSSTLGYTLWWGSPAGMFVWVTLAWAASRGLLERRLAPRLMPAVACGAGLAVVALCGAVVAAGERPDEHLAEYRPLGKLYSSLPRSVPSGRQVLLLGALGNSTFRFKMAARLALVRHGVRPLSPGTDTRLGSWYELQHRRYDCTVEVRDGDSPPVPRAALVTRFTFDRRYPVSVWVWNAGCPRA